MVVPRGKSDALAWACALRAAYGMLLAPRDSLIALSSKSSQVQSVIISHSDPSAMRSLTRMAAYTLSCRVSRYSSQYAYSISTVQWPVTVWYDVDERRSRRWK